MALPPPVIVAFLEGWLLAKSNAANTAQFILLFNGGNIAQTGEPLKGLTRLVIV
jgi:hypothetical protein